MAPSIPTESIPSMTTYSDKTTFFPARGPAAPLHRRLRQELWYPATAQWVFLKSSPHKDRRQNRSSRPDRSSIGSNFPSSDRPNLSTRSGTSQDFKTRAQQTSSSFKTEVLAAQEAARQLNHTNSVPGRICKSSGGFDNQTIEQSSRAYVGTKASAKYRPGSRDFEAQAIRDYDRSLKDYSRISRTRSGSSEIEARYHFSLRLEQGNHFASALAAYRQVQVLSGGRHAFGLYNMGTLCMRLGKVPKAIDYFSRAIAKSKCNNSTPSKFYYQRAAAYRKSGDFEKAAQDYVLMQKCAEAASFLDGNVLYPVKSIDHNITQTASLMNTASAKHLKLKQRGPCRDTLDTLSETNDKLAAWTLRRSQTIARLPTSERNESDVQYLSDYMQKNFAACAALHPEVCMRLCRELLLSPEGALPAQTPLFKEQEEDSEGAARDCTIYFIFQGRVSMSKTANRMFQSSPHYLKGSVTEDQICEQESMWECPWKRQQRLVSIEWKQSQLGLCDLKHGEIFGHQGRYSNALRTYSAVTATTCVIGALSWHAWSRIYRAQHKIQHEVTARFLTRVPAFDGIPAADIRNLAYRATSVKITGSKVVCCKGQTVDGLLVVKNGELCQFSPCGLRSPPDMSKSFALSGCLSEPQHTRAFFTQLETAEDPLSFVHVNDTYHGFLSQTYVHSNLCELLQLTSAGTKMRNSFAVNGNDTKKTYLASEPVALALRRGDCFCVSSSLVPSRVTLQHYQPAGTFCAKATLISGATTELLFMSAAELKQELSIESREVLHRNLQHIAVTSNRKEKTDVSLMRRSCRQPSEKQGSNMLEQFVADTKWGKIKEALVKSVLEGT